MRGEVEIWDGDKLLHKEPNMLVDGAGELLADIMTVSPSLSGVTDHATSSILDSSNYTIQAISFGTGSDAFGDNAYKSSALKTARTVLDYGIANTTSIRPVSLVYPGVRENFDGSSYRPVVGLPTYPDPALKTLDVITSVSAQVSGTSEDTSGGAYVSSVIPGNGQLMNFLPSAIYSSVFAGTDFDEGLSGWVASNYLGAFAEGSSVKLYNNLYVWQEGDIDDGNWFIVGGGVGSFFNEVSSMDMSGFVNMVMSGSPGTTTNYAMSSPASGLCVSGGHTTASPDQYRPPFGTVEYSVMVSKGDLLFTTAYGGIYHLGLWTINMKESLLNGNTPPFGFSVLNNPRKYKLFARKGLSKSLGFIKDRGITAGLGEYKDLTIKWRLHFL